MTITITHPNHGGICTIRGELPQEVVDVLEGDLSYFMQGYERTNKYLDGEWDGKVNLFRRLGKITATFPIGYLDQVCNTLGDFGIEYEINSYLETYTFNKYVWSPELKLYDYQEKILMKFISNGYRGTICLPTGGGKTMVALRAIALLGHDTVIFVHRKELLHQWVAEIKRVLGIDAAIYGGGVDTRSSRSPITVCMIQTAEKDREYISAPFIIVDECHTVASDTAYKVAMRCDAGVRMGLSATPTREDGSEKKIFGACGSLITQVTVNDLVDAGFLATPNFRLYTPEPVSMTKWASFSEAYRMGIVANDNRNELVVKAAITMLGEDRQVYIHISRIGHGKKLTSMIPGAVFCSGTTKDRSEIIERFKNGEINCLVSTLLKEGVDIPGINGLIYAAGGKSEVALIQTLGRCLRVKKDGGNAVVVDLLDSGNRHLRSHAEDRLDTLSKTYGKLFKPEVMA